MGIFRLLTYLKENKEQATRKVDLRRVAQETSIQGNTPVLFCDFSNIIKELEMNVVNGTVANGKQSKFTKFYGGHLRTLAEEFKSFILALKSTGIEPVFVLDGKDTRGPRSAQWSTIVDRYMQSLERCDKWHQVCAGYRSSHQVSSMPHPFAVRCCKRVLIDTGSRFVQCQGEADGTLIALCSSTPGAIGILSNDTDFAVARNCRYFPLCLFDADDTVGFHNHYGQLNKDPHAITCQYTSDSILSTCLGIRSEQVIDLAILCGNDYTKPLNAQYHVHRYIGCNSRNVTSIAEWLKTLSGPLRENEKMKKFLDIHPDYGDALLASDATYLGQSTEAEVLPLVTECEQSLHFRTLFMSLENGIIRRIFFAEDLTRGNAPVSEQTVPIRSLTYSLLGLTKVKEYGRTAAEVFGCCKVKQIQTMPDVRKCLKSNTDIPFLSKANCFYFLLANPQQESASKNLAKLCQATGEQRPFFIPKSLEEPISETDYTRAITALGLVKFITTVMDLDKKELEAVIIALILTVAHGPPLYFSCRPSMRAVHLAGLLCTTVHSALPLCELMSLPTSSLSYEDVFDSSTFVALYMAVCTSSKDNTSLRQILSLCTEVRNITAVEAVLKFLQPETDVGAFNVYATTRNFMKAVSSVENEVLPRHILQLASIRPAPLTFPVQRYSSGEEEEDLESDEEMQSTPTRVKKQSQPLKKALPTQQKYSTAQPLKESKELPIMKHRREIVELIGKHQVSIIEGQTGSGKSTQVPQFILDHAIEIQRSHLCKVIVTQPRRMAAKTLAERVSRERHEPMNKTVGYRIGGERSSDSNKAKITFVTSGWLLKFLTGNPEGMTQYSHIILDEVHERSAEADFLCLVVRNLLVQLDCPTKVILMSATLEGSLYSQYFQKKGLEVSAPVAVGGRQFPVKEYFLDDVANCRVQVALETEEYMPTSDLVSLRQQARKRVANASKSLLKVEQKKKLRSDDPRIGICCDLLFSQAKLGEGTLVFVPGFDELMTVYEAVSFRVADYGVGRHFKVFLLHSQVPMSEQKEAFEEPAIDVAHILLATNVAESSVTIPKLRLVINFCLRRGLRYDAKRQMSMLDLDWCSHASCKQRAGRAGRVFPGVAIHLVPKRFHDKEFPPYDAPEMRTASMSRVYLEAKVLSSFLKFGGPSALLMDTLTPPSDMNVMDALNELHRIGAISANSEEKGHITVLGYFGLKLPLDLSLCRLILFGICFDCPEAAVIMAAGLSMRQDVFSAPLTFMKEMAYHRSLWLSAKTRWEYDHGQYSEPHMYIKLFRDWMEFKALERKKSNLCSGEELARGFAKGKGLSWERLLQLERSVSDIAQRIKTCVPPECKVYAQLDAMSQLSKNYAESKFVMMDSFAISTNDTEVVKIHGDPVTYKMLLVAAFSHNLLIGQAEFLEDTRYGEETSQVVEEAHIEGIALKDQSTLYMRPFHQAEKHVKVNTVQSVTEAHVKVNAVQTVTEADLQHVSQHIVWERKHIQTWLFGRGEERTAVVKFHASFGENPKTEQMRKHEGLNHRQSLNFTNVRSQVIAPDAMLRCDAIIAWQFGLRRKVWTFGNIRNMPRVLHPCSVAFNLVSKDRTFVLADGWRNPVGVACDVKNTAPFYAVAANLISLGPITKASGMCILPRLGKGANAVRPLLMALAFLDFHRTVKFCRVEDDAQKFSAILIDGYELRCPDGHHISLAHVMMINRVRKALSEVMSQTNHSILPLDQMAHIRPLIRSLLTEEMDVDTICDTTEEIAVDAEDQQDNSSDTTDTDADSEHDLLECDGKVKAHLWQPEHWSDTGSSQFPLFASVVPPGATLVKRLPMEVQIEDPKALCLAPVLPWKHKERSGQLNSDIQEYKQQRATDSSDSSDSGEESLLSKKIEDDIQRLTRITRTLLHTSGARSCLLSTVSGASPHIRESAAVPIFSVGCTDAPEASSDEESDSELPLAGRKDRLIPGQFAKDKSRWPQRIVSAVICCIVKCERDYTVSLNKLKSGKNSPFAPQAKTKVLAEFFNQVPRIFQLQPATKPYRVYFKQTDPTLKDVGEKDRLVEWLDKHHWCVNIEATRKLFEEFHQHRAAKPKTSTVVQQMRANQAAVHIAPAPNPYVLAGGHDMAMPRQRSKPAVKKTKRSSDEGSIRTISTKPMTPEEKTIARVLKLLVGILKRKHPNRAPWNELVDCVHSPFAETASRDAVEGLCLCFREFLDVDEGRITLKQHQLPEHPTITNTILRKYRKWEKTHRTALNSSHLQLETEASRST